MEAQLAPFVFEDNLVRVHMDDAENPWFVAKDVCKVLDIANHNDALSTLDDDEKGVVTTDPLAKGGPQTARTVSESGLYSLAFRSRKPQAKRFRKWVTAEVLPTLRRTGRYTMPEARPASSDMPEEARRLRPAVRAGVLNCAVQVAKMSGGTPADVDALYRHYCAMVGGTVALEALPEKQRRAAFSLEQEENAYRLVKEWTEDLHMQAAEPYKGRKMQAAVLYRDFCAWCDAHEVKPLNHKRFGQSLQRLFRKSRVSGTVHYWLNYPINN